MLSSLTAEMCDAELFPETITVASDSVQGTHPREHLRETWIGILIDLWALMHLVMHLANVHIGSQRKPDPNKCFIILSWSVFNKTSP